MSNLHLIADELGDIRALIRTLKAREAELRRRILERRPNEDTKGTRWVLSVKSSERRTLVREALPASILEDPKYWRTSLSQTLFCKQLSPETAQAGRLAPSAAAEEEDPVLIDE